MEKRIYLSPPHMSGREKRYLEQAFLSNWIAPLGPHVDGFETELAENLGVQCSLALNTGTVAMYLALLFNVSPGKRGFCSVFFCHYSLPHSLT